MTTRAAADVRNGTTRAPMHILLVEDNELNRDMLVRRLARHDITCTTAADGQEGVDLARSLRPDAILMDLGLPVLDGWEATRRIKADPVTRSIPIIVLTAHVLVEDRNRATATGCAGFVSKPVDLPVLLETIRRAVEETAASAPVVKEEPQS